MKISHFAVAAVMLLFGSLPADELLRNGDFAQLDSRNLPQMWDIRQTGGAVCRVERAEGGNQLVLTVSGEKQTALAIRKNLPLENGKKYILAYEVGGSAGAQYQVYLEYRLGGRLKSIAAAVQSAGEKPERKQIAFALPDGASGPYLVLRARKDTVAFRNLSLDERSGGLPADSLVRNGDFMECAGSAQNLPLGWELRGKGGAVTGDGESKALRLPAGALALQRKIALKPGTSYRLSCQVRGGEDGSSFMAYCEWTVGKKLQSRVAPLRTAAGEWSDCSLEFVYPGDASGAYVALLARKGVVEFRNVVIVEKK